MKRSLITGRGRFIGFHPTEFVLAQGMAVYATVHTLGVQAT